LTLQEALLAAILVVATVGLIVGIYVLHRVRGVRLRVLEVEAAATAVNGKLAEVDAALKGLGASLPLAFFTHFRQIESLYSIYREIPLAHPLPWTRGWAASPDFLWIVAQHVLAHRPKVVVECSSGVSTVLLAASLKKLGAGHVWSLEHNEKYADQTQAALEQQGLTRFVTLVKAPLVPHRLGENVFNWYDVSTFPRIDSIELLVIDGPPARTGPLARYPALPVLYPLLKLPATIFLDDSLRSEEQEILRRWAREFPDLAIKGIQCEKGCAKIEAAAS
jgi:rhodanese-related sulfurtransferase